MNALIVDDVDIIRKSISKNLSKIEKIGQVYEAKNGKEALEILNEDENIKLLITDWSMPEMDGIELVNIIRSDAKFKELYIIMVTAKDSKELVIEAVTKGVNDYIIKPYNLATLMTKVRKVFD